MNKQYLVTFLILFIFSIIDSGLFLIGEKEAEDYLEQNTLLDKYTGPIAIGALAAGLSMLLATNKC